MLIDNGYNNNHIEIVRLKGIILVTLQTLFDFLLYTFELYTHNL